MIFDMRYDFSLVLGTLRIFYVKMATSEEEEGGVGRGLHILSCDRASVAISILLFYLWVALYILYRYLILQCCRYKNSLGICVSELLNMLFLF